MYSVRALQLVDGMEIVHSELSDTQVDSHHGSACVFVIVTLIFELQGLAVVVDVVVEFVVVATSSTREIILITLKFTPCLSHICTLNTTKKCPVISHLKGI